MNLLFKLIPAYLILLSSAFTLAMPGVFDSIDTICPDDMSSGDCNKLRALKLSKPIAKISNLLYMNVINQNAIGYSHNSVEEGLAKAGLVANNFQIKMLAASTFLTDDELTLLDHEAWSRWCYNHGHWKGKCDWS